MIRSLLRRNRLFTIGLALCAFWVLIALLAPLISPYDPLGQDMSARFQKPSLAHICGTDSLGRDILSRVLAGSRISIGAGFLTILLSSVVGVVYGGIAGYLGGAADEIMMRGAELVQAFPTIILAMVISAALGPSLFHTLLAMVVIWWPNYARVMRSMVIQVRSNEYVEAAKSLGASDLRIFFHEILPNSIGSIVVLATVDFGNAILLFSGLSFLGLGSPPPTPEWGAMVSDGADYLNDWWIATFPGIGILTMSMGANFIGDGVRDYLDPKLRHEV
ncbi:MAG: ABC transporter permease [Gracilibacteraceae bacterium]|jgi:peptide/nickel transport system permease protein|nr:ABC transporter permease [Gracilibacteraceae bacterium]